MSQSKGTVACVVAVALTVGLSVGALVARQGMLVDADAAYEAAQSKLTSAKADYERQASRTLAEASDADLDRMSDDSANIEGLLRLATTWDDYTSYVSARSSIINDYGIAEDSSFMSEFMPAPITYTGTDGDERNTIDDSDANTTFVSRDTYLVGTSDGVYSYVSRVCANSSTNSTTKSATYIVSCDTTESGDIINLSAILSQE